MRRPIALIVPSLLLLAAGLVTDAAVAVKPTGRCPSDYEMLTREQVGALPDRDLALAAFDVVNANGDAYVCYRPYPNGSHNGHYGNFIDNNAAPHT